MTLDAAAHTAELVDAVCQSSADVRGDVQHVVARQTDRIAPLLTPADRRLVIARAIARLDGLDGLDELLHEDDVDEVMVNRGGEVWVDRDGRLERAGELGGGTIDVVLERVLAPTGLRLDRTNPVVDVRLPDGARLCAAVDPIAVDGTTVSIRRHRPRRIDLERFASSDVRDVLDHIVAGRCNTLVSGATSSGKTTLLAALAERIGVDDRLVVIEDTTELEFDDRHAVRLQARPASSDGAAAVSVADLVRTALRLRPDRLVVGEFRGDEVLAVVQALNTGHDGSLSTCHANSAIDALRRVETLVMQAAPSWPLTAIRRSVTRSLDVVVHLRRSPNGSRQIHEIIEVIEGGGEPDGRPLVHDGHVVGDLERARG